MDTVTDGLGDRYRCIVPELPFGAHTTPMPDDADLSLPALATLIAEFLTELDLRHVTLVCNDPSPPSAPYPSGEFPTTSSGTGSIRCATTPRSAATYLRTILEPQQLLAWADQQRTFTGPGLRN